MRAPWGSKNQLQWTQERKRSTSVAAAEAGQGPLQPDVGQLAAAEHAVHPDRIADAQAARRPLGIVVGQLVRQREHPHLQRVHAGVAQAGARAEHRQRRRPGGQRGRRHRRGIRLRLRISGTANAAARAAAAAPFTSGRQGDDRLGALPFPGKGGASLKPTQARCR